MKKVLLFTLSALLLLCSCERLFESRKHKLDRLVGAHWDTWKVEGKDTTMCIVDIANVVPIEWDTVVYVLYDKFLDYKNDDVINYMNNCYWPQKEKYRGREEESLHFWKNGKLVYKISLWIDPENEKGVCVYARNNFLVRDRSNARFHLEKVDCLYILRDQFEREYSSRN